MPGFLLATMWDGTRLLHTFKDGRAHLNAYLDDYGQFSGWAFCLYELTFDHTWMDAAIRIADSMIDQFWDSEAGGFYFTGKSHESLIAVRRTSLIMRHRRETRSLQMFC